MSVTVDRWSFVIMDGDTALILETGRLSTGIGWSVRYPGNKAPREQVRHRPLVDAARAMLLADAAIMKTTLHSVARAKAWEAFRAAESHYRICLGWWMVERGILTAGRWWRARFKEHDLTPP